LFESTAAAVSPGWLYKEEGIRRKIERQRGSHHQLFNPSVSPFERQHYRSPPSSSESPAGKGIAI
jgi:hypothetical protein